MSLLFSQRIRDFQLEIMSMFNQSISICVNQCLHNEFSPHTNFMVLHLFIPIIFLHMIHIGYISYFIISQTTWKGKYEIRKSHIKGKESENSYQELKRSRKGQAHTNTRKLNRDILMGTAIFLNQKRANVCEYTTKMPSHKYISYL